VSEVFNCLPERSFIVEERGMSGPDLISAIQSAGAAIAPLHDPIRPIREGDWLCDYPEPGQTFLEYLGDDPILSTRDQTSLFIQPIGDFAPLRAEALSATTDMLGRFYGLPVRLLDPIDSAIVPRWARRQNPISGQEQFLTRFILNHLAQNKPSDAVAVLGLTTTDLWPGTGRNFLFGQASPVRSGLVPRGRRRVVSAPNGRPRTRT
jgi:hypothetical protein